MHDYFGIDYEIVWSIIENDLENLIEQIESVISKLKSGNNPE
ncbi:MAG: HepT-like ribonuclease domain-containing protein [Lentimicrobium sp.]